MKRLKKALALAFALTVVMAFSGLSVFAAPTDNVSVIVNGVMAGDTVHLYKLATPTIGADNQMTLNWNDDAIKTALEGKASETGYDPNAAVQAAVAKLIADGKINVSGNGTPNKVATGTSVAFTGDDAVEPGYYLALVKNGTGSMEAKVIYQNMIINALPEPGDNGQWKAHSPITVDVKKTTETLTKTQKDKGANNYAATTAEGYKVGDYIPFKLATNIPSYPTNSKVAEFEISDNPTGLKIVNTETYPVKIKVGGNEVGATSGDTKTYALTVSDDGKLSIVFEKSYILANPGAAVEVTYSAELLGNDSNIEVDTTNNTAKIKYNNNPDEESYNDPDTTIEQKTYNFTLLKHKQGDESTKLVGAKFTLWDAATGGNQIAVIKDGNVYRPIKDGERAVDYIEVGASGETKGQATIVGLGKTTYYLQEEVAPAGYQKLTDRVAAAASETTSTAGVDHKIPNTEGSSLPETGGIGTTIFYIVGAILVVGAGILLISRRRMAAK